MKRIAKFHKVSKERFTADWIDTFAQSQEEAEKVYEAIRLPKRATAGSAGYDFFAPAEFTLKPGETVKIPTGIRVEMQPEWVLKCYPRSGLGFKYRLQLNNTVGIIDSDYFYSDNEGHIFSKITNDSNENKTLTIPADTGFMQGKMCIRDSSYIMEISSPGLDRPLKKDKDFERNMGKLVEIRTYRPIEKQKEFCGILTAYDSNSVTIDEDGTERVFDKKDTALIRLAIEF